MPARQARCVDAENEDDRSPANGLRARCAAAETRYVKMTAWRRIRRGSATNVAFLYALLLLGLAVATVAAPGTLNFLTVGNLSVLSQQIPVVAIMAIGAGVLMIAGDFDLSVAGMYTLASYLLALSIGQWGLPIPVGLAIAFSAAVLVGTRQRHGDASPRGALLHRHARHDVRAAWRGALGVDRRSDRPA